MSDITLTLGQLFERPIVTQHEGRQSLVGYEFQFALLKLSNAVESLVDKVALKKVSGEVEMLTSEYHSYKDTLFKKYGKQHSTVLRAAIERNAQDLEGAKTRNQKWMIAVKERQLKADVDALAIIEKEPTKDGWMIEQHDVEAVEAFNSDMLEVQKESVTFSDLNHKISVKDGVLSDREKELLKDLLV